MLRDLLVELPGVGTWPCDEINYIWRHGNAKYPSDEFNPNMATISIQEYIQRQFQKISKVTDLEVVVEKTCANSLRVGFVNKVIPDSKYIFIVRNGLDAVGSAFKRWKASLNVPYILKKARYVPPTDLPYYAMHYLISHLHRLASPENRLSIWGPAFDNIKDYLAVYSLPEVCALQWQACVENAERDFAKIASEKIFRLRYETFVLEPISEFARLAKFLNKEVPDSVNIYLKKNVRSDSIGKGRKELGDEETIKIRHLITNTLARYGYE
jgi:hypothetical protein